MTAVNSRLSCTGKETTVVKCYVFGVQYDTVALRRVDSHFPVSEIPSGRGEERKVNYATFLPRIPYKLDLAEEDTNGILLQY